MKNRNFFNLSPATRVGSKLLSYFHELRIPMNLTNHLLQLFHIWFFPFHNNNATNEVYKIFEEATNE